jgi:hypothetical protein
MSAEKKKSEERLEKLAKLFTLHQLEQGQAWADDNEEWIEHLLWNPEEYHLEEHKPAIQNLARLVFAQIVHRTIEGEEEFDALERQAELPVVEVEP